MKQVTTDNLSSIAMLCLCETLLSAIRKRAAGNAQRLYWLDRADKAISAIDKTLPGNLPDDFVATAAAYYEAVERDLTKLLEGYDGERVLHNVPTDHPPDLRGLPAQRDNDLPGRVGYE